MIQLQLAGLPPDGSLHQVEAAEVLDALCDTLQPAAALARLILLNAKPLSLAVDGSLDDSRDVDLTLAERPVLEPATLIFHRIVGRDADQGIRGGRQLALELVVLQVDDRNVAGVLCDIFDRILA